MQGFLAAIQFSKRQIYKGLMVRDYIIIGGGIAGLSMASFLQGDCVLLEKSDSFGGLSRSFSLNGVSYDLGPHIIFSKNQEVLDLHTSIIETSKIRRSNQIFDKGRYIKYPFENDLAALDEPDRRYCLDEFLENPYEGYRADNMLQFFLKTFGEGITRSYLQPYNEKIWKFDPSCMDVQMVERIPKPPKQDVIDSANGVPTEGYTHQLYFHYPKHGGFQTLIDKYVEMATKPGNELLAGTTIESLERVDGVWHVKTNKTEFFAKNIINTSPIHEFCKLLTLKEEERKSLQEMKYNSIYIAIVQVKNDSIGDHFALYVPNKDIIFHRLSKIDFLGESYKSVDGYTTLMAEVTFRPGSYLSKFSQTEIMDKVIDGLVDLGFIHREDVVAHRIHYEKYAYVIYDLDHRTNTDFILGSLEDMGIHSVGRFAQFEYLNTDGVIENTLKLSRRLNQRAS